jgi:hypothetical protein
MADSHLRLTTADTGGVQPVEKCVEMMKMRTTSFHEQTFCSPSPDRVASMHVQERNQEGLVMFVRLELLNQANGIQEQLARDGWKLERQADENWLARHLSVQDEPAARLRLAHLGLLTSGRLRIQFIPRLQVLR